MFFKDTNYSTNITTATPERVFALCKNLEKKNGTASAQEMKLLMEPDYIENGSYFGIIREVAKDLGLIIDNDNELQLKVDIKDIKTISTMRRYINTQINQLKNGTFYILTNEYYKMNTEAIKIENIANFAPEFSKKLNSKVDANALRAWRFWVAYLGLGYLDNMTVIPNAAVFLNDLIDAIELEKRKQYDFDEIISQIDPNINIIFDSYNLDKVLNYGFSSGLKTLSSLNKIKIDKLNDHPLWYFYKGMENKAEEFTSITIKK